MMEPKFPEGTPEYEAYRAELKIELDKFAKGEPPYEYEKDPLVIALAAARKRHTDRLTGPETCCVKIREPGRLGICGAPMVYWTEEQAHEHGERYSGWRHADRVTDFGHGGVPASYAR